MSFSPDGEYLVTGGRDSRINVYQRHKTRGTDYQFRNKRVLRNHSNSIYSVSFSPDGKYLASGGADNKTKIYEVDRFEEVTTLLSSNCRSVAFSPDGKYLASGGGDYTVKISKVGSFEGVTTLTEGSLYLHSASFSPDGKYIAITGSIREKDGRNPGTKEGRIKIYQVDGFEEIRTVEIDAYPSLPISFSPDSRYLAVRDARALRIYQVDGFEEIRTVEDGFPSILFYSVAFSPDGKYLASGGILVIKIHEVGGFEEVVTLMNDKNKACWSVAFSPDGKYLASGHMNRTIIRSVQ